jgi:hypothetical protein
MMALLVSLSFKREADDTLVTFANTVTQRMLIDPQYASLKPYVEAIDVKNKKFTVSIADAVLGGKDRSDDKKTNRMDLEKSLVFVARQLEYLADGNARFITDSGYTLRAATKSNRKAKNLAPIESLETPVLKVKNLDKAGYAEMEWEEIKNALYYGIQFKLRAETTWTNGQYNHVGEFVFTNLESDNVYEFQVRAMGPFGILSSWSAPVPVFIT